MVAKRYLSAVAGLCLGMVLPAATQAEGPEQACLSTVISSVPSRPTVSNGADTTQCGVVEAEYGLERQWPGGGAHRDDLSGGLRLGLTPRLDFHWASGDFWNIVDGSGRRTGFGDTWLGLKYRFLSQTKHRPGLAVFYQAKVPSADETRGFGSGQVDHAISFLVSQDIHRFHFDFNATPLLAGRQGAPGVDHNTGLALSFSVPLTARLGLVAEGYGYTFLNQENPAFASTMAGVTYQVHPRLLLDTGMDVGVSPDAPHKRIYVGVTYAIGNLYAWIRPAK
jgi:Putative MetA-pathway of phenol degradation